MKNSTVRLNHNIRAQTLRIIDGATGNMLGIMSRAEALKLAAQNSTDLIEIAPQADPPVCRLEDFGKYKYAQAKKHKHQTNHKTKEILIHVTTDQHDLQTKSRHAAEFLRRGDKVKITLKFRGREAAHMDIGHAKMQEFLQPLQDAGVIEQGPRQVGKHIVCLLKPATSSNTHSK
jgi:translation initiation factor IF-3